MPQAATLIIIAWAAWCGFNVSLFLIGPWLFKGSVVTNGITTNFPASIRDRLTEAEQAAILAHEEGHKAHRHALKNLVRACLLVPRPAGLAQRQEFEADDYAASQGHGPALASALRVLSVEAFDRHRARRLLAR